MSESSMGSGSSSIEPDEAPEWTEEMFATAEIAAGDRIIRPGKWRTAGRPPLGEQAKRQATLRLDPDVIDRFREGGPGWQGRINEALRRAVGL